MSYLDCFILGVKGFLIALGFCMTAFICVTVLAIIGSLLGIGKERSIRVVTHEQDRSGSDSNKSEMP